MPGPTAALPLAAYRKLFRKALLRRLPVDKFESFFNQLLSHSPIPATAIADAILEPSLTGNAPDPLHLQYVGCLVERDIVSLTDILTALFKHSAAKAPPPTASLAQFNDDDELHGRESLEQGVFLVLAHILRCQQLRSPDSAWSAIQLLGDWMEAVMAASAGMLADANSPEGMAEPAHVPTKGRLDALGELVSALGSNEAVVKLLNELGTKEKKLAFQTSLGLFAQFVGVQNPALARSLEDLRQQFRSHQSPHQQKKGLKANTAGEATIDGMMMGLGADGSAAAAAAAAAAAEEALGPLVLTRAHLFIWLESLLFAQPNVDDEAILGYLHNRYKENTATMAMDFITAAIDVTTNALVRHEPPNTLFLLRSFLCNKVPLILARISPSLSSSYAISQTFLRIDAPTLMNLPPSIFEPHGYNSNSSPDMLFGDITIDLRQDFLFACALHGVIGEQDIQGILGELPLGAVSASGAYNAPQILAQCATDPSRVDRLLEEIESIEGNSGAVVRALLEVMKNMCESRETMPLRNICSYLARKPSSIDVMLLFVKPAEILEPLCDLLDTWRYEGDQGEYQPVYEEFGYILLLVLTLIHRYSFSAADIAFSHEVNRESFVPRLLNQFSTAQRLEALDSSEHHAQLGGWIKELFEDEGISNGLMMSCQPQGFYRLVPTLFAQSMMALQRGVLDLETVKGAFSFLLVPFLLPSVISGLSWLSQYLWSNLDSNPYPILQILTSLVIAHDITPEAAETQRTVVSISARPLDSVLRELLRRPAIAPEVASAAQQLLVHLKPHLHFQRSGSPTRDEMGSWVSHSQVGPPAGIAATLASLYSAMFLWSLPGEPASPRPPTTMYTSRLILAAHRLLGARLVVDVILHEAAKCRASHQVPGVAEDVAVALLTVFIPDEARGMTLREALRAVEEELEDSETEAGSGVGASAAAGEGGDTGPGAGTGAGAGTGTGPGYREVALEIIRRVDAARRPWIGAPQGQPGVVLGAMELGVGLEEDAGMDLMMGGVGVGEFDGGMDGMLDVGMDM